MNGGVGFKGFRVHQPNTKHRKQRQDAKRGKEFGKANADATTEYSQKNYPAMRTQTDFRLSRPFSVDTLTALLQEIAFLDD